MFGVPAGVRGFGGGDIYSGRSHLATWRLWTDFWKAVPPRSVREQHHRPCGWACLRKFEQGGSGTRDDAAPTRLPHQEDSGTGRWFPRDRYRL